MIPTYTDVILIPLKQYLVDHQKALSDAEWQDAPLAIRQRLQTCIDYAHELLNDGDVYLPNF